jgi:hypothetical protein
VAALLHSEGIDPVNIAGDWLPTGRSLARYTVANARLGIGFEAAWTAMHKSFEEQGWAGDWFKSEPRRLFNADQTIREGAMSRYGMTAVGDDFCEYIAWPATAARAAAAGLREEAYQKEDFACQAMRAYAEGGVPAHMAAAWTKLQMLHDLGLVHSDDLATCIGSGVSWSGPTNPAMEFNQEGEGPTLFNSNVEGGLYVTQIEASPDERWFRMRADGRISHDGDDFDATAHIGIFLGFDTDDDRERVTWPRGVYPLGAFGADHFRLDVPENSSANFIVSEGYMLIARASNTRVDGSVFIREVQRSVLVPFPQVFDPPLIVRFSFVP